MIDLRDVTSLDDVPVIVNEPVNDLSEDRALDIDWDIVSESVIDLSELNSLPVIALVVRNWDKDLYNDWILEDVCEIVK